MRKFLLSKFLLSLVIIILNFSSASSAYQFGDIPLSPKEYQKHLLPTRRYSFAVPSYYDARNDNIITPAKEQGNCGACWLFAAVGTFESHLIKYYKVNTNIDLSEQQVLSCNSYGSDCKGGSALCAFEYWKTRGPLKEEGCLYQAVQSSCYSISKKELNYRVKRWYTLPKTATDFKRSVFEEGPGVLNFSIYSDFSFFWHNATSGAVYTQQWGSKEGSHAVLIIGWDDVKKAFLCKNSWGVNGGPNKDGTFWIAYSSHVNPLNFGMLNINVERLIECQSNADCDDGVFCNGVEQCIDYGCNAGTSYNPCDDNLFCNGEETCDEVNDVCTEEHLGNPCTGECFENSDECINVESGCFIDSDILKGVMK